MIYVGQRIIVSYKNDLRGGGGVTVQYMKFYKDYFHVNFSKYVENEDTEDKAFRGHTIWLYNLYNDLI
jgi:hypothetical protein